MCVGAAGGCLASCVAGLCTSCTCKMCGALGKTVSMATRLTYGLMLLLGAALAVILNLDLPSQWLKDAMSHIWFSHYVAGDVAIPKEAYGKYAVYRVMGGIALFHFLLAIVMIKVTNSQSPRAKLNNGCWTGKLVVWVLCILLNFFLIPSTFFTGAAGTIFKIGGFMFIVIQAYHLVSFSYFVWDKLIEKNEQDDEEQCGCGPYFCNCWSFIMIFGTIFMYAFDIFVFGVAVYKHTEADDGCPDAVWGVSIGFCLMILTSCLSISSAVRDAPNGQGHSNGIGQSGVIAAYASYMVLSAMVNHPDQQCRPFSVAEGGSVPIKIMGLALAFLAVLWSAIRMGSSNRSVGTEQDSLTPLTEDGESKELQDDESEEVQYSYCNFHVTFGVAAMYLCMLLTQWGSVSTDEHTMDIRESKESVWLKIVASWLCYGIYMWVMILPPMCPDRDFTDAGIGDAEEEV